MRRNYCGILGSVIKDIRKEKKLSQEVLSGLAGISRSHLALIENGKKSANIRTLWSIADALKIPLSSLIQTAEKQLDALEGENAL